MRVNSNYQTNYLPQVGVQPKKTAPSGSAAPANNNTGLDTVQISAYTGEHFADVFAELTAYLPENGATTTIEQKETVLGFIDRMLACNDITPELRTYWENKKVIIQNEIQNIINEQNIGQDTDFETLEAEFWEYSNTVWNRPVEFDNVPDRVEYWTSYYNTCISYIDRLLNCEGITDEKRNEYELMRSNMLFDLNNHKADLNRYNAENGKETESFWNVLAEMRENVPDQTTTIPQKLLALSYINRMLTCNDIGSMERVFWTHQKEIIQQEIDNMNNG